MVAFFQRPRRRYRNSLSETITKRGRLSTVVFVTVHTPDVFRVRPGGHGFSRCAGTANHRAAPDTQPRGGIPQPLFVTSGRLFTVVDGNRAVVGLRGMMVDG